MILLIAFRTTKKNNQFIEFHRSGLLCISSFLLVNDYYPSSKWLNSLIRDHSLQYSPRMKLFEIIDIDSTFLLDAFNGLWRSFDCTKCAFVFLPMFRWFFFSFLHIICRSDRKIVIFPLNSFMFTVNNYILSMYSDLYSCCCCCCHCHNIH